MSFSWTSPYVETRQDALDAFVAAEFPSKAGCGTKPASCALGRKLDLGEFLGRVGVEILREIHDDSAEVAYGIRCPWVDEHTDGDESGTRVGQYPDGATWFRCEHSHCGDRAWAELREHVDHRVKGFKRNVTVYQASRKVSV